MPRSTSDDRLAPQRMLQAVADEARHILLHMHRRFARAAEAGPSSRCDLRGIVSIRSRSPRPAARDAAGSTNGCQGRGGVICSPCMICRDRHDGSVGGKNGTRGRRRFDSAKISCFSASFSGAASNTTSASAPLRPKSSATSISSTASASDAQRTKRRRHAILQRCRATAANGSVTVTHDPRARTPAQCHGPSAPHR